MPTLYLGILSKWCAAHPDSLGEEGREQKGETARPPCLGLPQEGQTSLLRI